MLMLLEISRDIFRGVLVKKPDRACRSLLRGFRNFHFWSDGVVERRSLRPASGQVKLRTRTSRSREVMTLGVCGRHSILLRSCRCIRAPQLTRSP